MCDLVLGVSMLDIPGAGSLCEHSMFVLYQCEALYLAVACNEDR